MGDKNTRATYEICSKLTTKTAEQQRHTKVGVVCGSLIINFERNSQLVLLFVYSHSLPTKKTQPIN